MAGCEGLSHTAARKKWRLWAGGGGGRAVKPQREMLKRIGRRRAALAATRAPDETVLAQNLSSHQLCQRPEMHLKSIY